MPRRKLQRISISPRLPEQELIAFLSQCPDELCDVVLNLRDVILSEVPEATEAIKFGGLCYFRSELAYGSIGGNVCLITIRRGEAFLEFLHGAFLFDPKGLLSGSGKAKRRVRIRTMADCRDPAIRALIRSASSFIPPESG